MTVDFEKASPAPALDPNRKKTSRRIRFARNQCNRTSVALSVDSGRWTSPRQASKRAPLEEPRGKPLCTPESSPFLFPKPSSHQLGLAFQFPGRTFRSWPRNEQSKLRSMTPKRMRPGGSISLLLDFEKASPAPALDPTRKRTSRRIRFARNQCNRTYVALNFDSGRWTSPREAPKRVPLAEPRGKPLCTPESSPFLFPKPLSHQVGLAFQFPGRTFHSWPRNEQSKLRSMTPKRMRPG